MSPRAQPRVRAHQSKEGENALRTGIWARFVGGIRALGCVFWVCCVAQNVGAAEPWNAPYPATDRARSIFFTTFRERPKHLDPVSSYSENEALFTGQIYEPPLQYHFLKRPYVLVPLTVESVPTATYFDAEGRRLPMDAPDATISSAVYRLTVRPGIRYAPHPALARDRHGHFLYHTLGSEEIQKISTLEDFPEAGTRELIAEDYVYQIKRLALPQLHSPILGFMSRYIRDLEALAQRLSAVQGMNDAYIDLRSFDLTGAKVIDRYTFEITLTQKYPQFVYWLAMPFFAPVPWEADAFYFQSGMNARNLSLDWHPLGTGPYMLRENNPNRRMTLVRNPNFHREVFPTEGEGSDVALGLLADAGARLPFMDEIRFMLEKEEIPAWNKFLQGYYDSSAIAPDGFDQAVRFTASGEPEVTPLMAERNIRLTVATQMSISYVGFNMLDPMVGGSSERARLLRRALAIAIDFEEMISIFGNGRGIPAHGPLPPGIFGYRDGRRGINPIVYEWRNNRPQRRKLDEARSIMQQAGYANGIDAETGAPLVLYLDATTTGPDSKSLFKWYRKQFSKLGIDLVIRTTDYNRFQDKMQKGQAQIFSWGWNADYPDPENFLFLLYGPNGKANFNGENAANYANPAFDALFRQMRSLPNGTQRQQMVDAMMDLVRGDGPWLWGFHPQAYSLQHAWVRNSKPNLMARNTMKYRKLDPNRRVERQRAWNQPTSGALIGVLLIVLASAIPAVIGQLRRRRAPAL